MEGDSGGEWEDSLYDVCSVRGRRGYPTSGQREVACIKGKEVHNSKKFADVIKVEPQMGGMGTA